MSGKKPDSQSVNRLAQQSNLPTLNNVANMDSQARRHNSRVELPMKPDGRPIPALLAVQVDAATGKASWSLHDTDEAGADIVWGATDPEHNKVVQAMRDWWVTARLAESWGTPDAQKHFAEKAKPPAPEPAAAKPDKVPAPAPAAPAAPAAPTYAVSDQIQPAPVNYFTPPVTFPSMQQQNYIAAASGQAGPYPGYPGQAAGTQWPPAYAQPLPPELWSRMPTAGAAPLMLGDVLVAAGIIPTRALNAALTLQNSSNNQRRIGEILVSSGALPDSLLQAAVRLQEMARTGAVPNAKMTEVLKQIHGSGESLEQALGEKPAQQKSEAAPKPALKPKEKRQLASDERIEREAQVSEAETKKLKEVMGLVKTLDFSGDEGSEKAKRLLALFKTAGLVDNAAIEEAGKSTKSAGDTVKSLLIKEAIDPMSFEAGVGCDKLMEANKMRPEQAIIALGYCQRSRVGLKEAIEEMHWDIDTAGL
jgi:hypothetical protein